MSITNDKLSKGYMRNCLKSTVILRICESLYARGRNNKKNYNIPPLSFPDGCKNSFSTNQNHKSIKTIPISVKTNYFMTKQLLNYLETQKQLQYRIKYHFSLN